MADQERRLYEKFMVERTDGRSDPGEKHHGCRYFVLDLDHDPFAWEAMATYATACQGEYPQLASDIRRMLAGETIPFTEGRGRPAFSGA